MVHYSFSFRLIRQQVGGVTFDVGLQKVSQGVRKKFPWDNKKVAHNKRSSFYCGGRFCCGVGNCLRTPTSLFFMRPTSKESPSPLCLISVS